LWLFGRISHSWVLQFEIEDSLKIGFYGTSNSEILEKRIEINNNLEVSVVGQTQVVRSFWNKPLLLSNFGQLILELQHA
jgi:hypothetical protein